MPITLKHLYAFIRLGRPQFLAGGFILHALGIAIALYTGAALKIPALFWGQVCITAIQWMTHYANDYFDLEADRANQTPTNWSGGSRILTDGLLSPEIALVTALILAGVATFSALVLAFIVRTGPLTLPLLLLSLSLAWFYSAPPIRLHSRGLGEGTTALLVAGLTPLIGFYLQSGRLELLPFLAVFPLVCLQFCMLLAVEFPDIVGDSAVGKLTLVVRLGAGRAARLYVIVLGVTYFSLPILVSMGLPSLVALAVGLMFPLAVVQAWRVRSGDYLNPARRNSFAFFSIALLFATAAVTTMTFALLKMV